MALNPRPVAAATALRKCVEFISTTTRLEILLAFCCFRPGGKAFAVDENPGRSMLRRFGLAGIMTSNTIMQILARAHVTPSGFLAA
jgi:hypothetical protein